MSNHNPHWQFATDVTAALHLIGERNLQTVAKLCDYNPRDLEERAAELLQPAGFIEVNHTPPVKDLSELFELVTIIAHLDLAHYASRCAMKNAPRCSIDFKRLEQDHAMRETICTNALQLIRDLAPESEDPSDIDLDSAVVLTPS